MTDTKRMIVDSLALCVSQAEELLNSTYDVMRAIENDGNCIALAMFDLHGNANSLLQKFKHMKAMADIAARRAEVEAKR